MYNRQHGQRRPPTIPQNYSGNAFYRVPYTEPEPVIEPPALPILLAEPEPIVEPPVECEFCENTASPVETPEPTKPPLLNLGGKLFPRGLGNEELLIIALILMASQSEDGNEILFYLILLLFC